MDHDFLIKKIWNLWAKTNWFFVKMAISCQAEILYSFAWCTSSFCNNGNPNLNNRAISLWIQIRIKLFSIFLSCSIGGNWATTPKENPVSGTNKTFYPRKLTLLLFPNRRYYNFMVIFFFEWESFLLVITIYITQKL